MRSMGNLSAILGIGVVILAAACSSKNGADNSGAGGSGYNPNSGNNGGTAPNGFPSAQTYTDPTTGTVDGLYPVTADEASKLKNAASVCAGRSAEPEGNGAAIMEFVMDITSSMNVDHVVANDNTTPTKWAVFQPTMEQVFPKLPSSFAIGAMYFAAPNIGQCYQTNRNDVPIALNNATQNQALVASVAAVAPNGATPTYQAWTHALQLITSYTPKSTDPPGMATAGRYIVLETDGVPTVGQTSDCTYLQNGIVKTEYDAELALIQQATEATKTQFPPNGVETFVVGVSGSNNPQNANFDPLCYLSKIAVIGGTAGNCTPVCGTPVGNDVNPRGTYCHIDLSNAGTDLAAQLSAALTGIAGSVLPCTYTVPPDPSGTAIDPNKTILVFTDGSNGAASVVLENTSTTCDQGWHFTDSTNTQIEVCGQTCKALQANSMSSLSLVFGCTAGQIIG